MPDDASKPTDPAGPAEPRARRCPAVLAAITVAHILVLAVCMDSRTHAADGGPAATPAAGASTPDQGLAEDQRIDAAIAQEMNRRQPEIDKLEAKLQQPDPALQKQIEALTDRLRAGSLREADPVEANSQARSLTATLLSNLAFLADNPKQAAGFTPNVFQRTENQETIKDIVAAFERAGQARSPVVAQLATVRGEVKKAVDALEAQRPAARQQQGEKVNLARLAGMEPLAKVLLDDWHASGLDGGDGSVPRVASQADLLARLDLLEQGRAVAAAKAAPLLIRFQAQREEYAAIASGAGQSSASGVEAQKHVVVIDAAVAALNAVSTPDLLPVLAYHRALLARGPKVAASPGELATLGALLAKEQGDHPEQWRAPAIVGGYREWWDSLAAGMVGNAEALAANPDQGVAALGEVERNDPSGVAAGRYASLVERIEDAIGAHQQPAPGKSLASVNAWAVTRTLGLAPEVRAHHIDLLNRFSGNASGSDLVVMARVVADDRVRQPAMWPDPPGLLALYARLQAAQFKKFIGSMRTPPEVLANAKQQMNRGQPVDWSAIDHDDAEAMHGMTGGKALWADPCFRDAAPDLRAQMRKLWDGPSLSQESGFWERAASARPVKAAAGK